MSKNLTALAKRRGVGSNLFEQLIELQPAGGEPVNEQRKQLAREHLIGEANIIGTASFYDFIIGNNAIPKLVAYFMDCYTFRTARFKRR